MDIYFIIGRSGQRKSSLVRALTGVRTQTACWSLSFGQTPYDCCITMRAAQESNLSPIALMQWLSACHSTKAILALRFDGMYSCGDAQSYIDQANQAGHTIVHSVELGSGKCVPTYPVFSKVTAISSNLTQPINQTAQTVRSAFNLD